MAYVVYSPILFGFSASLGTMALASLDAVNRLLNRLDCGMVIVYSCGSIYYFGNKIILAHRMPKPHMNS